MPNILQVLSIDTKIKDGEFYGSLNNSVVNSCSRDICHPIFCFKEGNEKYYFPIEYNKS